MSKTVNLGTILRHYAKKHESPFVYLKDFSEYLKKYAMHNLEHQPYLAQYIEIQENILLQELQDLATKHEIFIIQNNNKYTIVVLTYYSIVFSATYKDILNNPSIPFPSILDLPKQIPTNSLYRKDSTIQIPEFFQNQDTQSPLLYCLMLPHDIPPILFPECVPILILIKCSLAKIRNMLKKEEFHDYFLKKLRISNPNKEMTVRNFFTKFTQQPDSSYNAIEVNSEAFYFWNQLCYFIRQDFEKIKDKTIEDTNILQALSIAEIWILHQKQEFSNAQKKQEALAELEQCLAKPPYFYEMDSILKFKDSKGALLFGQFNDEDLKTELQKLTTETEGTDLPKLLVLKVESGNKYFIYKTNVFPLVLRLANEAHAAIEKHLVKKWYETLLNYNKLPEMKEQRPFEIELKRCVQEFSPILYALLNSNFLSVINFELNGIYNSNDFKIFSGSKLNPYSEILMLRNSSILSQAKMKLPFWYTIPIISWFASLFLKQKNPVESKKQSDSQKENSENTEEVKHTGKIGSKREVMATAAKTLSKELIPEGSTIDRELDSYHSIWNKMITKEARIQLTDDVNALIRDYMRKIVKTLSASTFTQERVQTLAETLVKTPNMQKIGEYEALLMYVKLYILRLVSNG